MRRPPAQLCPLLHLRAAPLAWVAPHPACMPFAPPPFTAGVALPIILCPRPSCAVPFCLVRPPCVALPLCAPPSFLRFWHACKWVCGGGGAPKWRGETCSLGGGACPQMGGGGHHPLCLPGMHAKWEGVRMAGSA